MPKELEENVEEINEDDVAAIAEAAEKVATEKGLETKVKDKMAAIFGAEDDDIEEEGEDDDVSEEKDDEKADVKENTEDVTDGDGETNKEVTDDTTSDGKKKTEDETLTLPAAHVQTAIRLGMSEDKVKEAFDKNPEAMISLLGELHKGENGLNARYAQQGRAIAQKHVTEQKTTADDDTSSESLVDIKKLRARFDDDDEEAATLIDGVIKPLADALKVMRDEVKQLRVQPNGQTTYNQQEDRAIQSEVNNFFDNDKLKEFQEYYGTVKAGEDPREALTGAQFKHRGEVCREGNFIKLGAAESGEQLTVSDVLQRAHSQITEPMREVMIREKITSKIKKRAKSLSVKAGTKKVPKTPSSGDAKKQLELTTKARLKKVFG